MFTFSENESRRAFGWLSSDLYLDTSNKTSILIFCEFRDFESTLTFEIIPQFNSLEPIFSYIKKCMLFITIRIC